MNKTLIPERRWSSKPISELIDRVNKVVADNFSELNFSFRWHIKIWKNVCEKKPGFGTDWFFVLNRKIQEQESPVFLFSLTAFFYKPNQQ